MRDPNHCHNQLVTIPILNITCFWILYWPRVPDIHGCLFTSFSILYFFQARHIDNFFTLKEWNLRTAVAIYNFLGN